MFDFTIALIKCLVPKGGNRFDAQLAENFKKVVTEAAQLASTGGVAFDPNELLKKAGSNLNLKVLFEVVADNIYYEVAKRILNSLQFKCWMKFRFYAIFIDTILRKGQVSYLYQLCCDCRLSKSGWILVMKMINRVLSESTSLEIENFKADRTSWLAYNDKDSGECCLHVAVESNDLDLVRRMHEACPSISSIKNKDKEPKTPKMLASEYENIKDYKFPPVQSVGEASVWGIDRENNVYYYRDGNPYWRPFLGAKLKNISISNNGYEVWGVGICGTIHHVMPAEGVWRTIDSPSSFESVAISANGQRKYAIDVDGNVYQITKKSNDENDFTLNPDYDKSHETKLKSISVSEDGSNVFGINRGNGACMRRSGKGIWDAYGPGKIGFDSVSVCPNGTIVMATDCEGNVYSHSLAFEAWVPIGGKKIRHAVVDDGSNLWGPELDGDDHVWYFEQAKKPSKQWTSKSRDDDEKKELCFRQISHCDTNIKLYEPPLGDHVWVFSSEGKLYHLSHDESYEKKEVKLPKGSSKISYMASNSIGDLWIVDDQTRLFCLPKDGSFWLYIRKDVGRIAAGKFGGLVWISIDRSTKKAAMSYIRDGELIFDDEDVGKNPISVAINDDENLICVTLREGKVRAFPCPSTAPLLPSCDWTQFGNRVLHLSNTGALVVSTNNDAILVETTANSETSKKSVGINYRTTTKPSDLILDKKEVEFFLPCNSEAINRICGHIGTYRISTTFHSPTRCPPFLVLGCVNFENNGKKSDVASYLQVGEEEFFKSNGSYLWDIKPGKKSGTYRIAIAPNTNKHPSGWEIAGITDPEDSRYCAKDDHSFVATVERNALTLDHNKDWMIAPGRRTGTCRITTSVTPADHSNGDDQEWPLCAYGPDIRDVWHKYNNHKTSLTYIDSAEWAPMDWRFEKVEKKTICDVPTGIYKIKTASHPESGGEAGLVLGCIPDPKEGAKSTWAKFGQQEYLRSKGSSVWRIMPGSIEGSYRIEVPPNTNFPPGWQLSYNFHDSESLENALSYGVSVEKFTGKDWSIEPGRTEGTYFIRTLKTTYEDDDNWALSAWGHQEDLGIKEGENEARTYIFSDRYPSYNTEWTLEKVDESQNNAYAETARDISISSDGNHIWAIKEDGNLYHMNKSLLDDNQKKKWDRYPLKVSNLEKLSVS